MAALSLPIEQAPTLLTAPVEFAGDWARMLPRSAEKVIKRMRQACLDRVRLLSDRQPTRLRVERRKSGPPAVWLHRDGSSVAWIIVNIGERDWSKLAYQFGHELGHVMANSWQPHAKPKKPCQWIEEALVEAFSLHGLGRLAESWKQDPPFVRDHAFGNAIAKYRQNIIERYITLAVEGGMTHDLAKWFADHRRGVELRGLNFVKVASLAILREYERTPSCMEALGALNRWPGRTGVPIEEYFRQWTASCRELQVPPMLPNRLRAMLGISPRHYAPLEKSLASAVI